MNGGGEGSRTPHTYLKKWYLERFKSSFYQKKDICAQDFTGFFDILFFNNIQFFEITSILTSAKSIKDDQIPTYPILGGRI